MAGNSSLGYENFQRLNSTAQKTDNIKWLLFNFESSNKNKKQLNGFIKTNVRYYYNNNDYTYSVPQAFVKYKKTNYNVVLGRKIVSWNSFEHFWGLNHTNGNQGFTLLSEQQEGLTGIHFEKNITRNVKLSFFGSGIFIPSMNPGYQFKNGQITSRSEWATLPPSKILIQNRIVPVYYTLNKPKSDDIIFQKSLGINLEYGWQNGKISSSALYKPENNLRNYAEGVFDSDADHVLVEVSPAVTHHMVYGLEVEHKFNAVKLKSGIEIIDPNGDLKADIIILDPITLGTNNHYSFESNHFKVEPSYQRKSFFHATVDLVNTIMDVSINYIHLLSNNGQTGDDFYGNTTKWKKAIGFIMDYDFNDNLGIKMNFKYDLEMKDNIMKNELDYKFTKVTSLALGIELLRSPNETSYWGHYKTNDTVYSNIAYHF